LLRFDEQFDAAGGPRLPSDEPGSFERQHHLVNRRRADAKILLHIGFGRRPAVQPRVEVNKRQILALLRREGFCGATHAGHPIQLFVRASNEEEVRMNVRYRVELSQTERAELTVRLRSTSMHVMPRRAKSQASVMPTGPPPAMRTWTSFTPVSLPPLRCHRASYLALPKPVSTRPERLHDVQVGSAPRGRIIVEEDSTRRSMDRTCGETPKLTIASPFLGSGASTETRLGQDC